MEAMRLFPLQRRCCQKLARLGLKNRQSWVFNDSMLNPGNARARLRGPLKQRRGVWATIAAGPPSLAGWIDLGDDDGIGGMRPGGAFDIFPEDHLGVLAVQQPGIAFGEAR